MYVYESSLPGPGGFVAGLALTALDALLGIFSRVPPVGLLSRPRVVFTLRSLLRSRRSPEKLAVRVRGAAGLLRRGRLTLGERRGRLTPGERRGRLGERLCLGLVRDRCLSRRRICLSPLDERRFMRSAKRRCCSSRDMRRTGDLGFSAPAGREVTLVATLWPRRYCWASSVACASALCHAVPIP